MADGHAVPGDGVSVPDGRAAAGAGEPWDVAIVGLGPVGATLANQLGLAGLRVLVLERDHTIYPLPRAIHFDGETMRIFQNLGLGAQVQAVTRPGLKGMDFVNARGEVLMVRGGTAAQGPHGWASNHYFHQPELEQVLRTGLARFPNVTVRLGQEVVSVEDDGAGVTLQVRGWGSVPSWDLASQGATSAPGTVPHVAVPDGTATDAATMDAARDVPVAAGPAPIRARFVVGTDGGRSLLRRAMGVTMEDLGLHQPWLVCDAILHRDPGVPDHTVQLCDPARPMTICNVTGPRRRWEIMLMPGDDPAAIARPENVWPILSRWITPADATLERAVVYTFHSVIAQGWRRGRLLIAGDSAHQTPPFLGQGMCAGVRDAANLAWKLERVLAGADDALLDTYESERRPHVHAFIDLAVKVGDVIQTTDPAAAAARDARMLAGDAKVFEFPAPGLGAGVHAGPHGGQVFPQPRTDDGRLLDEVAGRGFVVIGDAARLASASPATRARWAACGAAILPLTEAGEHVRQWLRERDCDALLLRPDRYLMGATRGDAALADLSARLP